MRLAVAVAAVGDSHASEGFFDVLAAASPARLAAAFTGDSCAHDVVLSSG
ncbi:hypothetical protein FM113_04685 [Leucobacter sp. 7(1)]|nr:hypothetical protein FM113_04685 [Leucobacter sp. 7(1)]